LIKFTKSGKIIGLPDVSLINQKYPHSVRVVMFERLLRLKKLQCETKIRIKDTCFDGG